MKKNEDVFKCKAYYRLLNKSCITKTVKTIRNLTSMFVLKFPKNTDLVDSYTAE